MSITAKLSKLLRLEPNEQFVWECPCGVCVADVYVCPLCKRGIRDRIDICIDRHEYVRLRDRLEELETKQIQSEWISVKDRLPEPVSGQVYDVVLVYGYLPHRYPSVDQYYGLAVYMDGEWKQPHQFHNERVNFDSAQITHWMPWPDPPEDDK
jgi:hypothetical protein